MPTESCGRPSERRALQRLLPEKSLDKIYAFPETSLLPVGEASPGDSDYNGGRWEAHAVTFTSMDPVQFTNDEDLLSHAAADHLSISDPVMYFECPLFRL